jgi:hypothetical protein
MLFLTFLVNAPYVPGKSQKSCFSISLESAMDKLQIEPKKSKFWRPLEKCDYGNSRKKILFVDRICKANSLYGIFEWRLDS